MALSKRMHFSLGKFLKDLFKEISEDNVSNGAAALAYYLFFSIFPATILLLSLLPYLPIENLHQAVMDFIRQMLPGEAARAFEGVIAEVTQNRRGGLVSIGAILTLWAASAGLYAIMQQLNITYDVKESRPFWKVRGLSMILTLLFGGLVIGAFALIVFGGVLQAWIQTRFDFGAPLLILFATFRWIIIAILLLAGFAFTYYFGPDVEQEFRFITPGAILGIVVLAGASLAFRFYVERFGDYAATYGSIGAIIIMMLWLYITGLVILLGSEINALVEHYSEEGKDKGQKRIPANARHVKDWARGVFPLSARVGQGGVEAGNTPSRKPQPRAKVLDIGLAMGALLLSLGRNKHRRPT